MNQNDFNNAFDRIVSENSTYYLLAFESGIEQPRHGAEQEEDQHTVIVYE